MTRVRKVRVKNGQKQLARMLREFKGNAKVKVGFPKGTDGNVIDRAAYNEFGTEHIPERPFMRSGLRDGVGELRRVSKVAAKSVVDGRRTTGQALNLIGIAGVGLIQERITDLKSPPNAESTVERKGSSNPLIDTGEMRRSVTHKVER